MRIRFGDVFFKMVKKIKVLLNVFEFFCGQEIILIPWSLHINFYESPNRISRLRQENNASYNSFLRSFIKKKTLTDKVLCKAKVSLKKAVTLFIIEQVFWHFSILQNIYLITFSPFIETKLIDLPWIHCSQEKIE